MSEFLIEFIHNFMDKEEPFLHTIIKSVTGGIIEYIIWFINSQMWHIIGIKALIEQVSCLLQQYCLMNSDQNVLHNNQKRYI